MTRQEFIDTAFIQVCATYIANGQAGTFQDCYQTAQRFADERAKHCPFDDEPCIAKGEQQPESIYPWDEAPKGAKYATTNKYGFVEWWSGKPTFDGYSNWGTHSELSEFFIGYKGEIDHPDWRNSLEKRPENK